MAEVVSEKEATAASGGMVSTRVMAPPAAAEMIQ